MKKIIAVFLFLQVIWAASPGADADQNTLAPALAAALKVKVTVDGDNLVFEGSAKELEEAREILGDFGGIRRSFLPVSSNYINVSGVSEKIMSWEACFNALGIEKEEVSLANIFGGAIDNLGVDLRIPTNSIFNRAVASGYVNALKENSKFFKWACVNLKEFVSCSETDSTTHLVIRYGLLNQFLYMKELVAPVPPRAAVTGCALTGSAATDADVPGTGETPSAPAVGSATDTVVPPAISSPSAAAASSPVNPKLMIPVQSVLKRLIAACSGDVTLEPVPGRDGEYSLSTISLGRELANDRFRSTVDIAIDNSGSMAGEKIDAVNRQMPELLKKFQTNLTPGQELIVRVHSFNDVITEVAKFELAHGKVINPWVPIDIAGCTDLTLVAKMVPSKPEDGPRVVAAFTDGIHAPTNETLLPPSLEALETCRDSGSFARVRLCRVGIKPEGSDDGFFKGVAGIFAGAFDERQTIDSFCDAVGAEARALLKARAPVVLNLSGTKVVFWQRDDESGLYRAPGTVSDGSTITHHGVTSTVAVASAADSSDSVTVDPDLVRIAALEAELAELRRRASAAKP